MVYVSLERLFDVEMAAAMIRPLNLLGCGYGHTSEGENADNPLSVVRFLQTAELDEVSKRMFPSVFELSAGPGI